MKTNQSRLDKGVCLNKRVIAQNGVLAFKTSCNQIDLFHLKNIVELYPSYHLGQVVESLQLSPFFPRAVQVLTSCATYHYVTGPFIKVW